MGPGRKRVHSPVYEAERQAIRNAIHRCHNKDHQAFRDYGARGIYVQDELREPFGYLRLIEAIGPRPSPDHSLDRINNDAHYTIDPLNLRWTDRKTQQNNRRPGKRSIRDFGWGLAVPAGNTRGSLSPLLPHNGRTQTLADWARELGLNPATIRQRLRRGLPVARALDPSTDRTGERRKLSQSRTIELDGRTQAVNEWAAELGLSPSAIHRRLRAGRTSADALFVGDLRRDAKPPTIH